MIMVNALNCWYAVEIEKKLLKRCTCYRPVGYSSGVVDLNSTETTYDGRGYNMLLCSCLGHLGVGFR